MAIAYEIGLVPLFNAFEEALAAAQEAIAERTTIFEAELEADRLGNAGVTDELRAFAQSGAELQGALREAGEAVTAAEVTAQQARDQHAETEAELVRLAELLGLEAEPSSEPLDDEASCRTRSADRPSRAAARTDRPGQPARQGSVRGSARAR